MMNLAKKSLVLLLVLAWMTITSVTPAMAAKREEPLKAAFVRGGELWLKEGTREKRLAAGPFVRHPKWSFDGKWLAFTKGEEEQELWVLELRSGKASLVSPKGGGRFQWSPKDRKLAYQTEGLLSYVDADQPDKPLGQAAGIGNFSWLPAGGGFFASSQSELLPDGWTPISLYQIPLQALGDASQYITVHVLPKPSDDFFSVDTSLFKWSADGSWIAFLAKPTASLPADSNTLCVITADGVVFRTLDEMVGNEEWFAWAESGDQLAYIAGIGREATHNKQLKVLSVTHEKGSAYTPEGYVDQAFAWQDLRHIAVSRAVELKPERGAAAAALPFIARVELESGKQTSITQPSANFGAYYPVGLQSKLAWVIHGQAAARVIVAEQDGRQPVEWIKEVDSADSYYGQWRWPAVLSFYERPSAK